MSKRVVSGRRARRGGGGGRGKRGEFLELMEELESIGLEVLFAVGNEERQRIIAIAREYLRTAENHDELRDAEKWWLVVSSLYGAARLRKLRSEEGVPKLTFRDILRSSASAWLQDVSAQNLAAFYNRRFLPALRSIAAAGSRPEKEDGTVRRESLEDDAAEKSKKQKTVHTVGSLDEAATQKEPTSQKETPSEVLPASVHRNELLKSTPAKNSVKPRDPKRSIAMPADEEKNERAGEAEATLKGSTSSGEQQNTARVSQNEPRIIGLPRKDVIPGFRKRSEESYTHHGESENSKQSPAGQGKSSAADASGEGRDTRQSHVEPGPSMNPLMGSEEKQQNGRLESRGGKIVTSESFKVNSGTRKEDTGQTPTDRIQDQKVSSSSGLEVDQATMDPIQSHSDSAPQEGMPHEISASGGEPFQTKLPLFAHSRGSREGSEVDPQSCDKAETRTAQIFDGRSFYFVEDGGFLSAKRAQLLQRIVRENGGEILKALPNKLPRVLVVIAESEKQVQKDSELLRILGTPSVFVHKTEWITESKRLGSRLDHSEYKLDLPESSMEVSESRSSADGDDKGIITQGGWACEQNLEDKWQVLESNNRIVSVLKDLIQTYELLGGRENEFRKLGTQKAISAVQNLRVDIRSLKDIRGLHGIGSETLTKIEEIIATGTCRKAEAFKVDPQVQTLRLLEGIWGAGPTTAHKWYACGVRSLEDFGQGTKGNLLLNRQQKIGLKYYDEFSQRMPRSEVEEIELEVKKTVELLGEGRFKAITCGSYRRGRATCGDIDIILTADREYTYTGFLSQLIKKLTEDSFITDDLVTVAMEGELKYMGVCQLPGKLHRRIDIIVVPTDELACALVYFTGSAYFNRSMRAKARNMNYSLSQHSIAPIQMQRNQVTWTGEPIKVKTEKDIFDILKIPYRKPEERDLG